MITVLTNESSLLTERGKLPSEGKLALLDRCIVLEVPVEQRGGGRGSAWLNNWNEPAVAARRNRFRLLTSMTAFTRLVLRRSPWPYSTPMILRD